MIIHCIGKSHTIRLAMLAVFAVFTILPRPIAAQQIDQGTDGARLLKGAIDMHFHMDVPGPKSEGSGQGTINIIRIGREHGLRGIVLKDHYQPTSSLAYHIGLEVPGIQLFGGLVLNRPNGGINPAAVEFMATSFRGYPGKIVWMPAGDSEIESRLSKSGKANQPFVAVSRNGQLLPEVKEVISLIKKYNLVLATGHIAPEEALLVLEEGHRQGVQHMIATHPSDGSGVMTTEQMIKAADLGAMIEFDFRIILGEGGRADQIRKIGPDRCIIVSFWTNTFKYTMSPSGGTTPPISPKEYAGYEGAGRFARDMRARGFTNHELDTMMKDNTAKLLGLSILTAQN